MVDTRSVEHTSTAEQSPGRGVAVSFGMVAVVAGAGYLLASWPPFAHFLESALRSTRSSGVAALDPVLYGSAGVAAFVLFLALLRFCGTLLKRPGKTDPLTGYSQRSIEEFANAAAESLISTRVARESYDLLQHFYAGRVCIDLDDDLRDDLKLTDADIVQLHARLLGRTERREMREFTAGSVETVHDLLDYVEKAPAQHLNASAEGALPADVASSERATVGPSGLFLRDQVSGQSRRASDYIGPRRRASDNKAKRAYSGPHRRASDLPMQPPVGKSGERPRESSGEQTIADLSKPNREFVPGRKKRVVT